MTPRGRLALAVTLTLTAVGLLWNLARIGMPWPVGFGVIHSYYLLASVGGLIAGVYWIRMSLKVSRVVICLVLGAAWIAGGIFAFYADAVSKIYDEPPPHFEVIQPPPACFAALLLIAILGCLYLAKYGAWNFRDDRLAAVGSSLIAVGTLGAIGWFVHQVLANEESALPVLGQPCERPASRQETLRILCLNVQHGYPAFRQEEERFEITARILRHFHADIIVFQEAWNTNDHGNMAARIGRSQNRKLNYAYARANGSRSWIGFEEGAAVLTRFPIVAANRILLKPPAAPWENRITLKTKLDLGEGETLTLAGIHLSDSSAANDQAEFLLERLRGDAPDIIAGDFNATPDSRAVQALLQQGYHRATPTKAIHGEGHFGVAEKRGDAPAIDHVFLSSAFHERFRVEEAAWVITAQPVVKDDTHRRIAVSDHDAVLVDLKRR